MRPLLTVAVSALLLVTPARLFAKAPTTKITIKGAELQAPIEITDPEVLKNFQVWAGAGTSTSDRAGFIVDWPRGPVAKPPSGLQRYEVSFYAKQRGDRPIYVVFYAYDPSIGVGFVYLPGRGEQWYRRNSSAVLRDVEGKWFAAWKMWDDVAAPLISSGKVRP